MSEEPRFAVDAMLGKLARYLRILGYDTYYSGESRDSDFVRECERGRVVVTRDRGLHEALTSMGCKSVMVRGGRRTSELLAQLARGGLIRLEINLERSRCPLCNGPLRMADAGTVAGRGRETYICIICGNTYWKGSHWKNILKTLDEAVRWSGRQ